MIGTGGDHHTEGDGHQPGQDEHRARPRRLPALGGSEQGPGVFIIANANDLGDAQRQLGRLPFVALGFMTLDFIPVNEL